MKHNPLHIFSHPRRRIVNAVWRLRRKLPVIMTWDSYVEFERQSIQQGVHLANQCRRRMDAINMSNKVTSQVSEIIERKGF